MSTTTASNWSEPTKEQIAEWKSKFEIDTISVLKVSDTRDTSIKKAYMRPPTMDDLIRASASNAEKKGTYNKSLFENCVLDCDPAIRNVQALYQGAIFAMDKIVVAADVEVEKL